MNNKSRMCQALHRLIHICIKVLTCTHVQCGCLPPTCTACDALEKSLDLHFLSKQKRRKKKTVLHETHRKCVGDCLYVYVSVSVCVRAWMRACRRNCIFQYCMHVSGDLRFHPKGWWPRSCNSLLWLFHWLDYSYNYRQLRHSASDWLAQQAKLHTVILWIQHLSKAYPPIFRFGLE